MSFWNSLFGGGAAGGGAARVDGPAARKLVAEGALLLDVRTPSEFGGGHVAGAVNVPVDELERRLAEIPKGREIVVYCRSGARSARAATVLQQHERGPVHDLGPMGAW